MGQTNIMHRARSISPTGTIFSLTHNPPPDAGPNIAPLPATHLTDHLEDYQESTLGIPRVVPLPDDDIYRGATGAPPERPLSPMPSLYAQSSASSISSGGRGRRRGTLAAVVEAAIARWGRSSTDGSSSSSSSSSSTSSTVSHSRRWSRGRHRKGSTATSHTQTKTPAERAKAREEIKVTKRVPREFVLFLPESLCPAGGMTSKPDVRPSPKPLGQPAASESQRTLRTRHVKLIAAQLEAALKKRARDTRLADRQKSRAQAVVSQSLGIPTTPIGLGTKNIPRLVLEVPTPPTQTPKHGVMDISDASDEQPRESALGLSEVPAIESIPAMPSRPELNVLSSAAPRTGQQAWWLDVASPTWEDMRVLGKLLHLHPLTLEDILHEDPREKLELFPRLGYYFVVFRALETQAALKRPRPPDADQEGTVEAVNVYFVIFREGIVTFHFEDIAEHTDRVRQKIIEFEQTIQMSSDWIAHGLMDSVVDAFAPILRTIDEEVEGVDSLITNLKSQLEVPPPSDITIVGGSSDAIGQKVEELEKSEKVLHVRSRVNVKLKPPLGLRKWGSRLGLWMWTILPGRMRQRSKGKVVVPEPPTKLATFQTLLRMANTRRLVTSLGRLLATKSEVIGQLRKRLQGAGNALDWDEGDMADGQEVGIYLGDVQDHILTMQQALNHYERILSHDHPAYLAHLRVLLSEAKGGKDKMILTLSIVIFTVPAMQWPMGLGSMNVHIPNQKGTPYYTYWGIWVASATVVLIVMVGLVRWWWVRAKRKRKRNNKLT